MGKMPYIAFMIGDWKKDPAVTRCSPATRGIWFDFLCDMHEAQSGGVLTGSRDELCRAGRCFHADLDKALSELADTRAADISEREGKVTVICRRMHREAEISRKRSDAGSKGQAKRQQIPDIDTEVVSLGEEFKEIWGQWLEHRHQIRKPATALAQRQQLQTLKGWGAQRAILALRHSISNGWQGIFEPRTAPEATIAPQEQEKREGWKIQANIDALKKINAKLWSRIEDQCSGRGYTTDEVFQNWRQHANFEVLVEYDRQKERLKQLKTELEQSL